MSESTTRLKHSRFRHVFAKSVRRSEWYDAGPGHAVAVTVNPKMIALSIDVSAGGLVQVAKLCTMGRGHIEMAKIKDHQGIVCDVKWNPFNDNVLATASHDATVRVWHIDDMLRIRCLRISRMHTRRIMFIEWHSTVDNAVFSASLDGRIILWNIESDEMVYSVDDCRATSLSLSYNCAEFAVTTRNRELIIFNARTGLKERQTELVHDGSMPSRVLYNYSNEEVYEHLITTGTCFNTRRQIAVYDSIDLKAPLAVMDVDSGSGLLMPIIDNDLNLLYVAGKGDANIRFYELSNEAPFITYLNESFGNKAHTAVCALPKRGLNVSQCEIMRIFRVDATQLVIEPLSFIVPRKADCFQADLFPATRSPTPSLYFREWLAGLDRKPILIELKDCVLNCTNKPVTFCKESAKRTPKLVTADLNNDRKFRFLSQVTKPDYREVNEREDRDELLKIEQIKARIAAEETTDAVDEHQRSDKNKAFISHSNDDVDMNEECSLKAGYEVSLMNHKNNFMQYSIENDISKPVSGELIVDTSTLSPSSIKNKRPASVNSYIDKARSSPTSEIKTAHPHDLSSVSHSTESGIAFRARSTPNSTRLLHKKNDTSNDNGIPEHSDENATTRSCASFDLVRELEKELYKYQHRCEQLENIICIQQQDIDSLRYEIRWKDGRIEFLQSQLAELDATHSSSSHSP